MFKFIEKGLIIVANLKKKAEKNARVTLGRKDNQTVLKEGVVNEHPQNARVTDTPVVGVSIGSTLNMGDYESLRVDVWLTDKVGSTETFERAYERIISVVDKVLQETVNSYK